MYADERGECKVSQTKNWRLLAGGEFSGCWPAASLRSRKMAAAERGERSCLLAGGQCKVSQNVAARGEFKVSQNWRV